MKHIPCRIFTVHANKFEVQRSNCSRWHGSLSSDLNPSLLLFILREGQVSDT